jgi:hypothetical protein
MADDKRLDNLQDEIKLLKGELKNSLSSVRDYLLNMELPSSEFSTILAALSGEGGGGQKMTFEGNLGGPKDQAPAASDATGIGEESSGEADELPPDDEDLIDVAGPEEDEMAGEPGDETPLAGEESLNPEDDLLSEEENLNPEDALESEEENLNPEEELQSEEESLAPEDALQSEEEVAEDEETDAPIASDEELAPESELSVEEDQPMESDLSNTEVSQGIPKVNMLANLINWVARAKREIGYEQLATFLEVYGISGHLTPELKEVIIHLAEITRESPKANTDADIWSQSMLSLHGILTGGDAPLHPVIPSWEETTDELEPAEEEIIEIDKSKEKPVKLKLVFPNGNGKSKEFCIDLTPDNNGSS